MGIGSNSIYLLVLNVNHLPYRETDLGVEFCLPLLSGMPVPHRHHHFLAPDNQLKRKRLSTFNGHFFLKVFLSSSAGTGISWISPRALKIDRLVSEQRRRELVSGTDARAQDIQSFLPSTAAEGKDSSTGLEDFSSLSIGLQFFSSSRIISHPSREGGEGALGPFHSGARFSLPIHFLLSLSLLFLGEFPFSSNLVRSSPA